MKPERFTRNIRDEQDYCKFEVKDCPYQSIYDFEDYEEIEGNVDCELTLAIDKLGEIEDIEQKYGVDLVTLFKAFDHGAWFKNPYYKDEINFIDNFNIGIDFKNRRFDIRMVNFAKFHDYITGGALFSFRDCGKTWALTKEELEKKRRSKNAKKEDFDI